MSEENGRQYGEVVETTDEDGNVHYFEKVEEVEVDGQQYALLIYQGGEDDDEEEATEGDAEGEEAEGEGFDEEYVIMRVIQEEDGPVYEYIDDEEDFKKVVAELEKLDYDFDLSDDDEEEDGEDDKPEGDGGHVHGPGCHHNH